ncbi:restriction endonuclease subunit S [Leuconostoc lactis]|uniref:restriction endonuclease subunit S n=1 Tax=Leuconostoc lactis TaxID=1246 RepID=UPI0015F5E8EF|nr:restriction endonuclease subunit S [Leuconostoc lactis]MBA5813283.1 restriction endonuclease subunit S [Leuconostoc lactis]
MSEMVPKVRFQGFTDDWEKHKVGDLFKVTRGQVLAANETSVSQSEIMPYPVYSSQTKQNGLMGYYKDYLFDTAITWTTDGANAGTVNYREGKFYSTNVNGVLLSSEGYANKLVAEIINREAWKWVSHVGNPKLMNNVMENIEVSVPSQLDEHIKISKFLTKIDNIINLHQRKIDLLKEQKKGFLQKMFPKDGQLVPEVRFAGFADDWEQRKFGDVVDLHEEIVSGKTGLPIATSSRKGLFLQNEFFSGNRTGIDENTIFHKVPVGFITYRHMSDDSIFKFNENIFDTAVLVSKEYPVFKSNEHSNQTFLLTHLNNSPEFLKFSTQQKLGGTRVRLYFKNLKKYELKVPSKEEQDSIGLFFKQLDNLITLHQRKIDLLKEQKKGFLQKMFVS